jgi:hypothetical protein
MVEKAKCALKLILLLFLTILYLASSASAAATTCSAAQDWGTLQCNYETGSNGTLTNSPQSNWYKLRLSQNGNFDVWLTGPANATFWLQVYNSCTGSPIASSKKSGSNQSLTVYYADTRTYYVQVYSYSGTGNYQVTASFASCCSPQESYSCNNNDVYWYDSCGNLGTKKTECGSNSCGAWGSNYCSFTGTIQHDRLQSVSLLFRRDN